MPGSSRVLYVEPVRVDPLYDDFRVIYRVSPFELKYYSHAFWAKKPDALFREAMSDYLGRKEGFSRVMIDVLQGDPEIVLRSNVRLRRGDRRAQRLVRPAGHGPGVPRVQDREEPPQAHLRPAPGPRRAQGPVPAGRPVEHPRRGAGHRRRQAGRRVWPGSRVLPSKGDGLLQARFSASGARSPRAIRPFVSGKKSQHEDQVEGAHRRVEPEGRRGVELVGDDREGQR
ncbi:MAG: ABC-type transport auxiliary lipoprotein family protein [Ignavibacteriales bacterium]|nr:ABC-type transport auxiliary lipoprotein family protein [Ignavibacteriales bacterium]